MSLSHIEWPNYFFHNDFSVYAELLNSIPLGPLSDEHIQQLIGAFSIVDTGEGREYWTTEDGTNEWSLQGAQVIYNGDNKTSLPTRFNMQKALGLVFPETSVGPVGRLFLVWNDPAVAEPEAQ